ncbi:hypothetical protein HZA43_01630 [Candidatus Peregrinibacteria bacterium]|nr:hypothetical protein [Candidatus Peregrinibacteria bacterium]
MMAPSDGNAAAASVTEGKDHALFPPDTAHADHGRRRAKCAVGGVVGQTAREVHATLNPETAELIRATMIAIDHYLKALNEDREIVSERDARYLQYFLKGFITERDERADEVESGEVHRAAKIMNKLFKMPPFAFLCIDGRVNLTQLFGFALHMKGGSIQLPAGKPKEFVRKKGGGRMLDPNSNTARQTDLALGQHSRILHILDAHSACAAQKKHQISVGKSIKDDGLYQDVLWKREMAKALVDYATERHKGKTIIPIQVSFDLPHEAHGEFQPGYMFMGLEKEEALEDAHAKKEGFTPHVLAKLVEKGVIISTANMAHRPEIERAFASHYETFNPPHDWTRHYKETAFQLWDIMETMQADILPFFQAEVQKTFPSMRNEEEINDRAMLLLSNAFNAYCNNQHPGGYPDGDHKEKAVSVTERDARPCPTMTFGVNSLDHDTVASTTVFGSGIVRTVREKGRDTEAQKFYETDQEYIGAPVPVVVKEIVRHPIDQQEWEQLRAVDWEFIQGINWKKLSDNEFANRLEAHNPGIKIGRRTGISMNQLRKTMAKLYDRRGESAELLMDGNLVALPFLADRSRRLQVLVPFFLKGFDV